jgi:hypothetical protein
MNCEWVKEKLEAYLIGELPAGEIRNISAHLAICNQCFAEFERRASDIDFFSQENCNIPNPSALWCRISNTIEHEVNSQKQQEALNAETKRRKFTFGQVAAAALVFALLSSLLTIVAINIFSRPSNHDWTRRSQFNQTTFEKIMTRIGLMESPAQAQLRRLQEQEKVIDYWSRRVEERRAFWDENLRRGFDRNLQIIDQAAAEYRQTLEKNPDDELSAEMLDSVMTEKINLLREFAEL